MTLTKPGWVRALRCGRFQVSGHCTGPSFECALNSLMIEMKRTLCPSGFPFFSTLLAHYVTREHREFEIKGLGLLDAGSITLCRHFASLSAAQHSLHYLGEHAATGYSVTCPRWRQLGSCAHLGLQRREEAIRFQTASVKRSSPAARLWLWIPNRLKRSAHYRSTPNLAPF
jgi:hypothetical protein